MNKLMVYGQEIIRILLDIILNCSNCLPVQMDQNQLYTYRYIL